MKATILLISIVSAANADWLDCRNAKCLNAVAEDCLSRGLAFVPKDFRKSCCDGCAQINDVFEPMMCIQNNCLDVPRCEDARTCKPGEALIPSGGCYCCNFCAKRIDLKNCN